jgi:hypothetical protein
VDWILSEVQVECGEIIRYVSHSEIEKVKVQAKSSFGLLGKATTLATPEAFERDPGLVWLFYSYRRHKALKAQPNKAHYALTELSKKKPNFITLTQNVDGEHISTMSLSMRLAQGEEDPLLFLIFFIQSTLRALERDLTLDRTISTR